MYHVFKEQIQLDGETYSTYSLVSPMGTVIHDCTTDRDKAYEMASILTDCQVSEQHFFDVVEDMIV